MGSNRYQRDIRYNNSDLSLVIIRFKRKTMAIHVLPDGIEVRVPLKCPWIEIDGFIESRLDWLASAQEQMQNVPVPPKFLDGDYHEIAGEMRPLTVRGATKNLVDVTGDDFLIYSMQPESHEFNQDIFFRFLKYESQRLFPDRVRRCVEDFPLDVAPSGLRYRRMRARWGSCSERGEICLNTLLAQKDLQAVDLVIVHELCHLVHFHHSAEFYGLMDQAMPDWRGRESLLKSPDLPFGPSLDAEQDEELSLLRVGQQMNLF